MKTEVTQQNILWTPQGDNSPLIICGPSYVAEIKSGDSNAAQLFNLSLGSAIYWGDNNKIGFSIKVGNTAAYHDSVFLPKVNIDRNSRITLQGTGNIGGNSLTAKHFLSGKPDGQTMYVVLDLTNNTNSDVSVSPMLLLPSMQMMNYRWKDVGNSDTDKIKWDSVNQYISITSPSIENIFCGVKACSVTQHYYVNNAFVDINALAFSAGDLSDAINSIGASGVGSWIYSQYAETANKVTIHSKQTARFVWCIAFRTSLSDLNTFMSSLTVNPDSDLATVDSYHTASKMVVSIPSSPWVTQLLDLSMSRHSLMAHTQKINNRQYMPAGSSFNFVNPFGRDGYYGTKALLQILGLSSIVYDEYYLFKSQETNQHAQMHEVPQYVNANGLYLSPTNNGSPGDQDCYQILKAYEYYVTTQDVTFLSNEISELNNIGKYLLNYYNSNQKWSKQFPGAGSATYLDGEGNITGINPMHDPVMSSLVAYTMLRLAELNAVKKDVVNADLFINFADSIISSFSSWFNASTRWLDFNRKINGNQYKNKHLTKIDAGLWSILDNTSCGIMAVELLKNTSWWDDHNKCFNEMPTSDPLYNVTDYWYGQGWNLTMFKAIEFIIRYGSSDNVQKAWLYFKQYVQFRLDKQKGGVSEHFVDSGLFSFSVGAFVEMLLRGLLGLDAHASYFILNPNFSKLNLKGTYLFKNILIGNQSYTFTISGRGESFVIKQGGIRISNPIPYGGNTNITIEYY